MLWCGVARPPDQRRSRSTRRDAREEQSEIEDGARGYDPSVRPIDRRHPARLLAIAIPSLAGATLAVAVLQEYIGVPNASAAYLAAVVATAFVAGTSGAVVAAVASFLLYDFLFVLPLYTFTVADPGEWLNLVLLLFIGIVVGQLVAIQRSRTEVAMAREREARALFQVSRELATRESTPAVLPRVVSILRQETATERIWVALGSDDARERVGADTGGDQPAMIPGLHHVLQRTLDETPARWSRVHQPNQRRGSQGNGREAYRVRIEAGAKSLGSIWALRDRLHGEPDPTETRLLSAAADQIGQALAHDRLAAESQAAEIARQSDALKSALLQSVSHDLRTPLATIRAAAGTLRPDSGLSVDDQRESVDAIDREVEYLNRLVTNLLDMSRIEAGALLAERDVYELDDLVGRTIDRLRSRLGQRTVEVALSVPPVEVDPVFLDEALTNALENALKYTPAGSAIRISADRLPGEPYVRLSVEDRGPGVPDQALQKIFDKFYRVPGSGGGSRSGTGIGLAVARGLIEAMGGRIAARRGDAGGLAIEIDLPLAPVAVGSEVGVQS
jgi:two-component system sensor histidine kinase KdpD